MQLYLNAIYKYDFMCLFIVTHIEIHSYSYNIPIILTTINYHLIELNQKVKKTNVHVFTSFIA